MAVKVEFTNINPRKFVDALSRYADSTVMYWGDNHLLTFTTYKKHKYPSSGADRFAVIPGNWEYRPDLVSNQAYGAPDFWWRIMEANNIKDVFDFKAGLTIRLPGNIYL